jgi:hypothetical protein
MRAVFLVNKEMENDAMTLSTAMEEAGIQIILNQTFSHIIPIALPQCKFKVYIFLIIQSKRDLFSL